MKQVGLRNETQPAALVGVPQPNLQKRVHSQRVNPLLFEKPFFLDTSSDTSMALILQQSISVILPAYNEEENIAKTAAQAVSCLESLARDWEIIIVNDGSLDKTAEIITAVSKQDARIRVIHHESNRGYGAALKSGIQLAGKDLIFFCDSDLQFHLSEMILLLVWIEQYDIVVGFRANRRDPLYRRINAWGWNILVRLILGLKVKDIDCAFKLFRSIVFKAVKIDAVGAMVNTDILMQASRMGFKIKEVPVTHFPRLNGKATGANFKVILKAFAELFQLYHKLKRIRHIVRDDPNLGRPLPINRPDRGKRIIRLDGIDIPLASSESWIPYKCRVGEIRRPE